jgi:hypothetical protein
MARGPFSAGVLLQNGRLGYICNPVSYALAYYVNYYINTNTKILATEPPYFSVK